MPVRHEGRVLAGTSGWLYRHWRGVLYPDKMPQREWLACYVGKFPTVEINATFYRLPTMAAIEHWRDTAPSAFVYAVKAGRLITHLKRLKDCQDELIEFLARVRLLGSTLGPILYQLPPKFSLDLGRLEAFARVLPDDLVHVFEFRDRSWWIEEVRAFLNEHGLSWCNHDHGGVESPHWLTGRIGYWRFHGVGRGPQCCYKEAELEQAAGRIRKMAAAGTDVYAYFNNDAHGCAVRDATRLAELVSENQG
jgi:uncharacterized protein YecE (DUF72 family)